jgi:hypothetical protein
VVAVSRRLWIGLAEGAGSAAALPWAVYGLNILQHVKQRSWSYEFGISFTLFLVIIGAALGLAVAWATAPPSLVWTTFEVRLDQLRPGDRLLGYPKGGKVKVSRLAPRKEKAHEDDHSPRRPGPDPQGQ